MAHVRTAQKLIQKRITELQEEIEEIENDTTLSFEDMWCKRAERWGELNGLNYSLGILEGMKL